MLSLSRLGFMSSVRPSGRFVIESPAPKAETKKQVQQAEPVQPAKHPAAKVYGLGNDCE